MMQLKLRRHPVRLRSDTMLAYRPAPWQHTLMRSMSRRLHSAASQQHASTTIVSLPGPAVHHGTSRVVAACLAAVLLLLQLPVSSVAAADGPGQVQFDTGLNHSRFAFATLYHEGELAAGRYDASGSRSSRTTQHRCPHFSL